MAAAATPGPPAGSSRDQSQRALSFLVNADSTGVIIATVLLVVVIGILHPRFFSIDQLRDTVDQSVYVAILAAGTAFLIAMRELDLSIGSQFGLTLVSAALLISHGMNPWLAALIGIAMGVALGLFNALLVEVVSIPAIIATLGTLSMFSGLADALTNGQQVTGLPFNNSFFTVVGGNQLGVPFGVWVLIAVVVILTVLLRFTTFGYRVRSIGSNPDAASFSGISRPRVRIQALVLMGALCGVAGIVGLGFFASGDPTIGGGYELQAIAAAIIGGTPLRGGSATVIGAAFGAILLGAVSSGLVFLNVPLNWSSFATGAVIILAVSIDSVVRRSRNRRKAVNVL